MTGNTPAPTAVNNYDAALASILMNAIRGQDTLLSSREAMAATTSNSVYEGASIAQEHTAVKVLKLHHVDGIQTTGSTVQGCMSPCLPVLLQLT